MKTKIAIILCAIVCAGCAALETKWDPYDAGSFSLSMPSSLQKDSRVSTDTDTDVREFTNEDMVLITISGEDVDDPKNVQLGDPKLYKSHVESIAGQNVQIVLWDVDLSGRGFQHSAVAIFKGAGLIMVAGYRNETDYDDALKIFRSVSFKKAETESQ